MFVDKPTIGKTLNKTKYSPPKKCEISLQHPPHNSHIYNQLAPSSQIREKWATFVSICLTICYNNVLQINIHLSNFLSAKALTLCPYLHALVPLLHVNSRTNYCSQQPYFNVLSEKIPFSTLSRASNTPFLHIACLFFSLFPTFSTPVFCHFLGQKRFRPCIVILFLLKSKIVEQQMLHTRHRRVVLWHRIAPNVRGIVGRNFNWMIVQDIIQQPRLCVMAGKNFNWMIVQDIMQ